MEVNFVQSGVESAGSTEVKTILDGSTSYTTVKQREGILEDVKEEFENVLRRDEKEEDKVGILDIIFQKFISRKMLVFVIGTVFLMIGKLDVEHWVYLSICYIGAQTLADMVKTMKGQKS